MKRRGFTLIELLVVIAIIAILAAILFPVFMTAKERARQTKCLNNLKQLTQAFRQYCDDYNGCMPSGSAHKSGVASGKYIEWTGSPDVCRPDVDLTKGQLWKYVHNKAVYQCATDVMIPAVGITGQPVNFPFSYSLNQDLGSIYDSRQPPSTPAWQNPVKLDVETAGRSGKCLLLIHEGRKNDVIAGSGINDGYFSWQGTYCDIPGHLHWDGTTVSYADGHAKWASYSALLVEADNKDASAGNPHSLWHANSWH